MSIANATQKSIFALEKWQAKALILMVYDVIAVNLSYACVLWLRFDCHYTSIPREYLMAWLYFVPIYAVFCVIVFWRMHLYNSLWRFASYNEFIRMICATVIGAIFHIAGITLFFKRMPISYYVLGPLVQFCLTIGARFSYRFLILERSRRMKNHHNTGKRVMLIGAGSAGQMILRDMHKAKEVDDRVCCIIDDDPNKWNRFIDGIPIVGGREEIFRYVEHYQIDKIFLAIPSASAEVKRDILNICKETKCELKNLPAMYQLYNGEITAEKMQDVSVEELLGREPIRVDMEQIFQYLSGKTIFISGAGGSIGREISLQVAGHHPKKLVLLDVYENNIYDVQLELKDKYPKLDFIALIGSVTDSRKLNHIFATYRPDIVFHAAAHKHVPLMEDSPCEAIKNNAIGTYKTAYAAIAHGCQRFVLISTDKAVNPTNIMGASKRLCEMIIQSFDRKIKDGKAYELPRLYTHMCEEDEEQEYALPDHIKTEFVAVRFGNVLGSNGSVIPLFKKQIEKGGPVTVTHPDIIRYFMTIPEAVSLVLQSAAYAHGGEIFVFDMGVPVKIDTLARNLIRLSGFIPDVDIEVKYTGLRPGEKLYEEKLMCEEGMRKTPNDLIHIGMPIAFDSDKFLGQLPELMAAAYANSKDIKKLVADIVTTYHPAGIHGCEEKDERYEELMREVGAAAGR